MAPGREEARCPHTGSPGARRCKCVRDKLAGRRQAPGLLRHRSASPQSPRLGPQQHLPRCQWEPGRGTHVSRVCHSVWWDGRKRSPLHLLEGAVVRGSLGNLNTFPEAKAITFILPQSSNLAANYEQEAPCRWLSPSPVGLPLRGEEEATERTSASPESYFVPVYMHCQRREEKSHHVCFSWADGKPHGPAFAISVSMPPPAREEVRVTGHASPPQALVGPGQGPVTKSLLYIQHYHSPWYSASPFGK